MRLLRSSLGNCFPLWIKVITARFWVIDISPFVNAALSEFNTISLTLHQKNFINAVVIPSNLGDEPFFIRFNARVSSSSVRAPSILVFCSSDNCETSMPSKQAWADGSWNLSVSIAVKSNLFFNNFLLVCHHLTVTFFNPIHNFHVLLRLFKV